MHLTLRQQEIIEFVRGFSAQRGSPQLAARFKAIRLCFACDGLGSS
jgi:hypothetical protein